VNVGHLGENICEMLALSRVVFGSWSMKFIHCNYKKAAKIETMNERRWRERRLHKDLPLIHSS